MTSNKLLYCRLFCFNSRRNFCNSCLIVCNGDTMNRNSSHHRCGQQRHSPVPSPVSHCLKDEHGQNLCLHPKSYQQKSCLSLKHCNLPILGSMSSSKGSIPTFLSITPRSVATMNPNQISILNSSLLQTINGPRNGFRQYFHTVSFMLKHEKGDNSSESSSSNSDSDSDCSGKRKDADIDELHKQISPEKGKEDQHTDELKNIIREIKDDFVKNLSEKDVDGHSPNKINSRFDFDEFDGFSDPDENEYIKSLENDGKSLSYNYEVAEDIEEYDYMDESEMQAQQIRPEKVLPITLDRGEMGVFDLDEFLVFLNHIGAQDVVTIPIPPEAQFCDHMVIASVKSARHMQAIHDEFLWVHKRKKAKRDPTLRIEGENKSIWSAMDMGNIVLHLFYGEARQYYDIESLWLLGPENDPKCQDQSTNPYEFSPEDLFWLDTTTSTDSVEADGDSDAQVPPEASSGETQRTHMPPHKTGY